MKEKYPYEEAAGILKIVAHPVRLCIIAMLEAGKMNVGDIQQKAQAKQSVTSQHLNAMAEKGILARDRKGNEVYYFIKKKEVLKILSCIKGCCNKG